MSPWLAVAAVVLGSLSPCELYPIPSGPSGDMYKKFVISLSEAMPCVLLNDHHGEMGCSSVGEVTGPLRWVSAEKDVAVLQDAPPAVVLLTNGLFDRLLDRLAATEKVQGMIVYRASNTTKGGYSPEETTPNAHHFPAQAPFVGSDWNPVGSGRMLTRYNFPVWLTDDKEAYGTLVQKAQENSAKDAANSNGPRWVGQMSLNMASNNRTAAQCIEDRKCQPLGGGTSWATLRPIDGDAIQRPIIAVMGGISSSAMFHEAVTAANGVVSHVVALLAAFDALTKVKDNFKMEVVFFFFTGENYGYIGSTRFLADITTPYNCTTDGDDSNQLACRKPYIPTKEYQKIPADRLAYLLDVNQVGHTGGDTFYVHTARDSENTTQLVTALLKNNGVKAAATKRRIPPSSLVAFLTKKEVPAAVGAAVLAGYDREYNNEYYSSIYDSPLRVSEDRVLQAAQVVANAVSSLAGGPDRVSVDAKLVSELLHCLTTDFRCGLVRSLFPGDGDPPKRANWYPGAFQHRYEPGTPTQRFIYRFLAERTITLYKGNCTTAADCKYRQSGLTCVKGACVRTAAYMHQAFSPVMAWDYTRSRWTYNAALEGAFSTVVESDWSSKIGVRAFLEDNWANDLFFFFGGASTTAVAALLWVGGGRYFISKYKLE